MQRRTNLQKEVPVFFQTVKTYRSLKNAYKHLSSSILWTTTHSPTMHLNSQHAKGDPLTYVGLPVDISVIPYESGWIKIIYTFYYYLSSLSIIMPKLLRVEKGKHKKNHGLRLPEFLLRMKILPRIPLKGKNSKWWHPWLWGCEFLLFSIIFKVW